MNQEKFHNNGLRYYCNQNTEHFLNADNSKHCSMCNKNLIDFRKKTKSEYKEIIKNNKDGCGIFYLDQIGDEIEIKFNWKKPFLIFSIYLSFLFSKSAYAQSASETKIELADSTKSNKSDSTISTNNDNSHSKDNNSISISKNKKHTQYRNRKRLYLSGKFPFIHYDRHKHIGVGYW